MHNIISNADQHDGRICFYGGKSFDNISHEYATFFVLNPIIFINDDKG